MTRNQFIKKWLGNPEKPYTEQFRNEMLDDLDVVITQSREQAFREVYDKITDFESTGLALYACESRIPGFKEAVEKTSTPS